MSALSNIIPESSLIERKRSNFTKSLDLGSYQETGNQSFGIGEDIDQNYLFFQSVHVLSQPDGKYEIYSPQKSKSEFNNENLPKKSLKWSLKKYLLGIKSSKHSNKKKLLKGEGENIGRNYAKNNHDNVNCQILIGGNHEDGSQCSCSKFHHHTFQGHTFFLPPEIPDKSESELLFSSKFEFLEANQRHLNVCNTFWRPSLSLNQQNYANRRTCYKYLVDFESLWPEENSLRSLLTDGIQNTALHDAISELALLAVVCGPVHLLESLINLSLVSKLLVITSLVSCCFVVQSIYWSP